MNMKRLLKWFGVGTAQEKGRVRRVFLRNGMEMRNQLRRMAEMKQEVISVGAMKG